MAEAAREPGSDGAPPSVAPAPVPPPGAWAWAPGLWQLRNYRLAWLGRDVSAGLVLTALLVPAGMGYAEASGLPAVTGLYATIAPLLAYAAFGPSRIMVLGPDSALAAMIAAAVVERAHGDPERAVALASVLALFTGAWCLAGGFLRAGSATSLLSRPVRVGYLNGIGLTIVLTQLPKLCGFAVRPSDLPDAARGLVDGLWRGRSEPVTLAIGLACLVALLVGRAVAPRFPTLLAVVVASVAAVSSLDLEGRVRVVGVVPTGLPLPSLPRVGIADLGGLAAAAAGIALVSFADTSVLSRSLAARHGQRVDGDRELVGLGFANVAAGLFQGFPISSSSSRTPVAESAGSRTQLTGVVGAIAIVALLTLAPGLLGELPTTTLAAVVIAAALQLFDLGSLRTFYRVRRSDLLLAVAAFVGVAVLGVLPGIAVAVALSLLDFVRRAVRPHHAVLGRAPGVKGYHDVTRYPDARQVPGLVLFRWDAPLFFANAEGFRERILDAIEASEAPPRWIVVAAEPITDVDTTAAEVLEELDDELGARGVELAFAEVKDPVRDRLDRYGLRERVGRDFFFPTIGVAVKAYLSRHDVGWRDWEEG